MKPNVGKRRKGCHAIARQRARHARRQGRSQTVVLLVFLWAFLSGPFRSPSVAFLPGRSASVLPRQPNQAEADEWPVTEYERGASEYVIRPRSIAAGGNGRYRSQPSFSRLMTDLRRPAAREDAAAVLKTRIADPVIRAWVTDRIAKEEINRLSIWVQPGCSEKTILEAWRDEADAALAETEEADGASSNKVSLLQVAKLLESLAGAENHNRSEPGDR